RAPRHSPVYGFDEDAVWRDARQARAGALEFLTLSDEDYVAVLAVSLFEDIGFGKGNLKQVLDLYLLLRQIDAVTDWEAFFARHATRNLLGVLVNVLHL